jgi:hypothetical protein
MQAPMQIPFFEIAEKLMHSDLTSIPAKRNFTCVPIILLSILLDSLAGRANCKLVIFSQSFHLLRNSTLPEGRPL